VESIGLGQLFSIARTASGHPQGPYRHATVRHSYGRGSSRADGGQAVFGADGGAVLSPDSYGYRPGKSALDAVEVARHRCWRRDWVLDLDLQQFFDTIEHGLMYKAVAQHTDCPWALLYIERWLKAPVQLGDGTIMHREKGTPQGSAISPLLANLFLHYAFDRWMQKYHPNIQFERFADDIICHCTSEA